MSTKTFGTHLRELRRAQGLSLNMLARQAGIGAATVSRWESGRAQPRLKELEAALQALGVTAARRRQMLAGLDAPRVAHRLRQEQTGPLESNACLPPSAGGLLRAMRCRRRFTQAQAAALIGVTQSTLTRWERGDLWPCSADLHRLCYVLNAHEAEVVALTCRPETLAPPLADAPLSREEARAWMQRLVWMQIRREQTDLLELHFCQMMAGLWPLYTVWGIEGRLLLAEASARHAEWLLGLNPGADGQPDVSRRREAAFHAEQSLAALPEEWVPTLIASLVTARLAVYRRNVAMPARGIALLRPWLSRRVIVGGEWEEAGLPLEYAAWMRRDMAEYLAQAGNVDEALHFSAQAVQAASLALNPIEKHLRESDHVELLLYCERPQEALDALPPLRTDLPPLHAWGSLQYAEALDETGQRHEAHEAAERALQTIQEHNLVHLQERAGRLARRF